MAISNVLALKRENAPQIGARSWTSYTGYNYGRWADRGFNIAWVFSIMSLYNRAKLALTIFAES